MCNSSAAKLIMGIEPAFYVDSSEPDYCFVPCGHMANAKTVKYWSSIPIPCGTSGFQSACPFCATPLLGIYHINFTILFCTACSTGFKVGPVL